MSEKNQTEDLREPATIPPSPNGQKRSEIPEIGGSDKPEPTRYGDWEVNGRCTDF